MGGNTSARTLHPKIKVNHNLHRVRCDLFLETFQPVLPLTQVLENQFVSKHINYRSGRVCVGNKLFSNGKTKTKNNTENAIR